jgi:hypothetical protein
VRVNRLQNALNQLGTAVDETRAALDEMRAESDPLAVHIFVSRRQLRHVLDTKSGKRSETAIRLSWQTACEIGFRGSLEEWGRLMEAPAKR